MELSMEMAKKMVESKKTRKAISAEDCGKYFLFTVSSVNNPDALIPPLLVEKTTGMIKTVNPVSLTKEEKKAIKSNHSEPIYF